MNGTTNGALLLEETAKQVFTQKTLTPGLYFIRLPGIYRDIKDLDFSASEWEKRAKKLESTLEKIRKAREWIANNFNWNFPGNPPVAFKISLNKSVKLKIRRQYSNYVGFKRTRNGRYVLTLDVDDDLYYRYDFSSHPFFYEYQVLLQKYFKGSVEGEDPRKVVFEFKIKSLKKGKKVFLDLLDSIEELLLKAREKYVEFVKFLKQPIIDYSQITKPVRASEVTREKAVSREKAFEVWRKEVQECFQQALGSEDILCLPWEKMSADEMEKMVKEKIQAIRKLRQLIKDVDPEMPLFSSNFVSTLPASFSLSSYSGNFINIPTPYFVECYVPLYYSESKIPMNNDEIKRLPFVTDDFFKDGKKKGILRYFDMLESFLQRKFNEYALKKAIAGKQRKSRKMML